MGQWCQEAVDRLHAFVSANFATYLRTVETADGLAAGSLTNPSAYVKARIPGDNRSPLVQIYEEGWEMKNQRNRLYSVECTIVMSRLGDVRVESNEEFIRRYERAMIETIVDNATLGSTVIAAMVLGGEAAAGIGDASVIRQVKTLDVMVDLHSP